MDRALTVICATLFSVSAAVVSHADFYTPDTDFEDIEEICSELNAEYEDAAEYIEERELEDAREPVGRMVNLSAKMAAYAPSRRHNEFKEQSDLLKEKCLELEQAVVGWDSNGAWNKIAEVRQVCHACHDLY